MRDDLLEFLRTVQRPGADIDTLADDQNLFDSGTLDSLAVLQIILFLEQRFGVDLSREGVDPTQLNSITNILELIRRAAPC